MHFKSTSIRFHLITIPKILWIKDSTMKQRILEQKKTSLVHRWCIYELPKCLQPRNVMNSFLPHNKNLFLEIYIHWFHLGPFAEYLKTAIIYFLSLSEICPFLVPLTQKILWGRTCSSPAKSTLVLMWPGICMLVLQPHHTPHPSHELQWNPASPSSMIQLGIDSSCRSWSVSLLIFILPISGHHSTLTSNVLTISPILTSNNN